MNYIKLLLVKSIIFRHSIILMEASEKLRLKKLEDNQEMLRFAIDAAVLGTWDLDPVTNKFTGNERLKSWFGLSHDEEIDLEIATNAIADKDRERVVSSIQKAMEYDSGGEYDVEYSIIHPETKIERIYRAKGKTTFDENNKPLRLNGILQDVTDQVVARKAMAESESHFRQLADAVPSIIWITEPNFYCSYLNKNWYDFTGQTADEAEGFGWQNAVHPEDRERTAQSFMEANQAQKPISILYRLKDFKGNYRWVMDNANPRYDFKGEYMGFVGTVVDVHDQIEGESIIKQNEQRLKLLIDESPMRITLLTGPDLVIKIANEQILKSWGKDKDVIGMPLLEALPEIKDQAFPEILKEVYETGVSYSAKASKASFNVGGVFQTFYFDIWYKPLFNASNEVYAVLTTAVDVTEKIVAEQKRDDLEHRFRMLIEETSVATCLFTGEDLVVEIANDIMISMWGKDRSVIGKPFIEGIPEMEGQPFIDILQEVRRTGIPYVGYDMPADLVVDEKLQTFYFDFTYKPLYDYKGDIIGIMDTAVDVTEKVINRRKLEESENRFRSLIAHAPVAIGLFVGRDLVIDLPNQIFNNIVGKGDVTGMTLQEAMPELITEGQPFLQILDDVFTSGKIFQTFGTQVKIVQNGIMTYNYYDFTYTPIFNLEGEVYAILDIAIDVTESVLALKRIEEAEEKARLAIESADLGPYETNLLTGEMKTSDRFNEIWGIEKTVNRSELASFIHPDDMHIRMEAHQESLETGYLAYEARVLGENNAEKWVRVKGKVIYDSNKSPVSLIGVIQDITEQKLFSELLTKQVKERTLELQRSNDDLLQFAHVASHDLKEPVRKIKIFSNMLEQEYKDLLPERGKGYLAKIQNSTDRMFSMVEGVLAYSAITSSERPIDAIDLNDVIESIESDLEILIQKKKVKLRKDKLPVIEGALVLIHQLFYNLINNALKFAKTDNEPLIVIESALVGGHDKQMAKIVITDNGIGLDPDYVHKIFDVFSRLNGKDEYEGTGLGLALCKKIVQRHHGTIQATGVKGESASFIILLPVKQVNKII